jgi:hypothetical protein
MADNEPSLRHRVSAHTTPQDTTATDHQYPTGIKNRPNTRQASRTTRDTAPHTRRLLVERDRLGAEHPYPLGVPG